METVKAVDNQSRRNFDTLRDQGFSMCEGTIQLMSDCFPDEIEVVPWMTVTFTPYGVYVFDTLPNPQAFTFYPMHHVFRVDIYESGADLSD